MKSTTLFVAVGLAFCQLAGAAPTASSANSIAVQWWIQPNFTGDNDKGDAMPGECYRLENPFRGTVQSLQVDAKSTCIFFTQDACAGWSLPVDGSMAYIPWPYNNNLFSYQCQDKP